MNASRHESRCPECGKSLEDHDPVMMRIEHEPGMVTILYSEPHGNHLRMLLTPAQAQTVADRLSEQARLALS